MSEWQRTFIAVAIVSCPVLLWNISRKADAAEDLLREIRAMLRRDDH